MLKERQREVQADAEAVKQENIAEALKKKATERCARACSEWTTLTLMDYQPHVVVCTTRKRQQQRQQRTQQRHLSLNVVPLYD